jgi:hypothetical protein
MAHIALSYFNWVEGRLSYRHSMRPTGDTDDGAPFGLAYRLSALGLFGMRTYPAFVVPGGSPEHILWFSLLTLIIAGGPRALSLDHLIWNSRLLVPAIAHRAQA